MGDRAHVEQAIPIRITPCQTRNFKPQKNSNSPQSHLGIQVIESGTFDKYLAGDSEIFVDGDHLASVPTERDRFLGQGVLTCCRLAVVFHLRRMGLPNVDNGGSSGVAGLDLVVIDHDFPLPICALSWRSVVARLRWRGFVVVSPAFPTLEFLQWGGRESSACVARWAFSLSTDLSSLPLSELRRLRRASTIARA